MIVLHRCRFCFAECKSRPSTDRASVCKSCEKGQGLQFTEAERSRNLVDECVICRNRDFYVRDDIHKGLGLLYLITGAALAYPTLGVSLVPSAIGFYWYFLKYPKLTVCYHCYAKYRNTRRNPQHREYDPTFFETLEKQIRNDRPFPHFD